MRKLSLFFILLTTISSALAQLNGDGYYRIRNNSTKRYVYVTDNKGSLNYSTTSADMNAIQLWLGFEKASSDPATVCYIKSVGDSKYDIQAQGTGIYEMIKSHVSLRERNGMYLAYASKDGVTKYLSDGEHALSLEQGVMSGEGTGDWRNWDIIPLSNAEGAYFGMKPTISLNGKHYLSFYAEFPFSFAGSGMKAMYIYKIAYGVAVYKEITGTIPGETPIFVECSSDQIANNKLNIGGSASKISGNLLAGVYFDNKTKKHYNRTPNNPTTMRLLGTTSDGKLAFVKSSIDFIPANTCYLQVTADMPDVIPVLSEQEYLDYVASITPKSVTLNNTTLSITEGQTTQLTATVAPATAQTTITWATSNNAVATVSTSGLVTAVAPGTATITATTHNGLKATCTVTVKQKIITATSISLDKTNIEVTNPAEFTLVATVLPANTTNKAVTWKSSNTAVATVDANGKVKTIAAGETTITATTADGTALSASCKVTVRQLATSISLDKTSVDVVYPAEFTLTATVMPASTSNKTIKWLSSNETIATVDANGNVKVIAAGKATITATTTDGSALSATCEVASAAPIVKAQSIELSQTSINAKVPSEFTLSAIVLPSNTTDKTVTWSSSNTSVATVDANGKVNVISYGEATITATTSDGSNLSASCKVVTEEEIIIATSISLDQTSVSVEIPAEFTLTATVLPERTSNKGVIWASSNEAIATVDAAGNVSVIAQGEAIITATTTDGSALSASCVVTGIKPEILATSITLDCTEKDVVAPFDFMLIATVLPDNTTNKTVKWSSSNTDVAKVDDKGNVNVLRDGEVVITATTTDGTNLSAQCKISSLAGVDSIVVSTNKPAKVYTLSGIYVTTIKSTADLKNLRSGLYIIDSKKIYIK